MLDRIKPRTLFREEPIKGIVWVAFMLVFLTVAYLDFKDKLTPLTTPVFILACLSGGILGLIFVRYILDPFFKYLDNALGRIINRRNNIFR
ncbi:MAG: hypothetical protein A2816_00010 [Candidatus Yanofskybacteria bacterium RIFCSPHIGHO2_01_FULL_39_44]|uniref:Uncharacterized protein n=1 Tax=Candidatus Yanofskybacteria bacterium RIFCSPHIGHO2_02_FULL_43_22 TaxID=1802681 RepID=A0A1F8FQD6_9BACT|nr:MAG: hypothetical protein A2816_00010 [Candidatus Yanofskybacteria bacterium RIFCSPHIGHO2_01_FULL_39_44]OGN15282.1 MAG: hypothetical protein A3J47_00650 [Candidatus Yanofskybacteria bacterium RIFCSPHIGHO2_02_FULL_43_22]